MWIETMDSPSMRWKAMAGFLVVIFFTSGTSALVCYQSVYFHQFSSQGNLLTELYSPGENVTCSPADHACIDAQLKLSIVSHIVVVRYRGCTTTKDPPDGSKSTTSDDGNFAIQYDVTCCSKDLCNAGTATEAAPDMIKWAPEPSKPINPSQCYSGLIFHEHETTLERVTCHQDSDQCYQGIGNISTEHLTSLLYIRSCHSTCTIPQREVFGPIEFSIQGTCCHGNFCNKKEDADPAQNNHTSEAANDSWEAVNHTTNFINNVTGDDSPRESEYDDSDEDDRIMGTAFPTLHPRAQGPIAGRGVILPLSPLLIALGITLLGLLG
ncbi:ly6/PLAUR domain-containing protein 5-like [Sceloporus undulatus]|uniref:ly6/PLAUR domain-containing protein 5-like n=1 Tax=Sceloporus undulatus TaxID=8520 RepID=UPI001C4D5F90|nr:ly6/PLAUR domain-containing protein 5-like [Sceloporus undulatus]